MCHVCGEQLPANTQYFDVDNSRDDGLRLQCKACRAKREDDEERKTIAAKLDALDSNSVRLLTELAMDGSDVPHIAEVFQKLLDVFGGISGFAQHFMANYLMSKPGSQMRQRMLQSIITLGIKVTESGGAELPLELLNDADIEREIVRRSRKLISVVGEDGVAHVVREDQTHPEDGETRPAAGDA